MTARRPRTPSGRAPAGPTRRGRKRASAVRALEVLRCKTESMADREFGNNPWPPIDERPHPWSDVDDYIAGLVYDAVGRLPSRANNRGGPACFACGGPYTPGMAGFDGSHTHLIASLTCAGCAAGFRAADSSDRGDTE